MPKLYKKNRLVQGVGINNANYHVHQMVNGKKTRCKFYTTWAKMLERCFCKKFKNNHPTYKDATVCKEWLYFMNFRSWMMVQDWDGNALDKDIIEPGNRLYSPETCCFVPRQINNLLCDSAANRGDYLIGVSLDKVFNKFTAQINIDGKKVHLGRFFSEKNAHNAYKKAKIDILMNFSKSIKDIRISNGLSNHAKILMEMKNDVRI